MQFILGSLIAVVIFSWTFTGLNALGLLPKSIFQWIYEKENQATVLVFVVAGALVTIGLHGYFHGTDGTILKDIAPELIGIGPTVLILERFVGYKNQLEYKKQIILQMASMSNDFALDAVRILRQKGWLEDGSLRGAYLGRANLAGANLQNANLENAYLGYADLAGTELAGVNLSGARLEESKLQQARLYAANLEGAMLFNADLRGAYLYGANLQGAWLESADLTRANLLCCDLRGANLMGTTFKGAGLVDAKLYGCRVLEADFQEAVLFGTVFQKPEWEIGQLDHLDFADGLKSVRRNTVSLNSSKFSGAMYTDETVWPYDFDPKSAGAIQMKMEPVLHDDEGNPAYLIDEDGNLVSLDEMGEPKQNGVDSL